MRLRIVTMALLGIAVAASAAHAIPPYALRGGVLGQGGNPTAGGGFVLQGTVGQPATLMRSNNAFTILCSGYWCFGGVRVLAVGPPGGGPGGDVDPGRPTELSFGPSYPNPTRGTASFSLGLPADGTVRLAVYDVTGRLVGEPFERVMPAGYHRVWWNTPGEKAGVYFATLSVDGRTIGQRRIVVVH